MYEIKFDPRTLETVDGSDVIKSILDALKYGNIESVIIKGGLARFMLLLSQGENPVYEQLRDIDIVLPYYGNLLNNAESLINKESILRERLSNVLNLETISLDTKPLRVKRDVPITSTYFGTRDLTINQTLMFVKDNSWRIGYSKRCWRDLVKEQVGMINPFGPRMTRIDHGIRIPTNRGFYRLMRAWAHKKVEAIWLPRWQIKAHLTEMKRIGQKPLGNYLSLIVRQYENENPEIQERWVKILNELEFTELTTFKALIDQTKKDKEFIFTNEKIPFRQELMSLIYEMKTRQAKRQARTKIKNLCDHKWEIFVCNACGKECVMQRCAKPGCKAYKLPCGMNNPDDLPCNRIFISGDWSISPENFIYL
ncbi:MAG: hypothetical protein U9Q27_00820 [Patescibacteria group bacterium]|nr:hypothetical protein [Patescibacteria group bacterium]